MKDSEDYGGLDIDELTPAQLRKLLRRVMAKGLSRSKEEKDEDIEKAEEEREKLSKMREESNGKGPSPKVKKEDLPSGLSSDDDEEEDDKEDSKE